MASDVHRAQRDLQGVDQKIWEARDQRLQLRSSQPKGITSRRHTGLDLRLLIRAARTGGGKGPDTIDGWVYAPAF